MVKDLHQCIIRCTLLQSNYQFLSESDANHAILRPGTWICPGSSSPVWMLSASDHAAQVWRWLLEDIKLDSMKLRASSKSWPVQLWYTIIALQQFYKPLLISHHDIIWFSYGDHPVYMDSDLYGKVSSLYQIWSTQVWSKFNLYFSRESFLSVKSVMGSYFSIFVQLGPWWRHIAPGSPPPSF